MPNYCKLGKLAYWANYITMQVGLLCTRVISTCYILELAIQVKWQAWQRSVQREVQQCKV